MTVIQEKISDDEFILSSKCWDFTIKKNNDIADDNNDNNKKNADDIFQEIIKKLVEQNKK